MIQFGNLNVVEKTFSRKDVAPRGQAYEGIKFRRYDSKKAGEESVQEVFVIADKAFEKLNLETLALAQANFDGKVFLLVVEDQDEVEPIAKFMRRSKKRDGTLQKKGKMFNNTFLKDALIEAGILDGTTRENQYLSLSNVTAEVAGLPSHVSAVYQIEKDATVNAADDTEDSTSTTSDERDFN